MTVVHPNHIVGINSITVQTGDSLSVHKADGSLIRTIVSNTGVSTFHAIEVSKGGGDLNVGVSTFFVDNSTGRVGVGTAVPGVEFSVTGDGTVATFESNTGDSFIGLLDKQGAGGYGYIGSNAGSLLFQTSGSSYSTKLEITAAGLVNIGGAAVSQSRSLNIGSNAEANLAIETHNDATSETANIRFYKSGNTGASPQVVETDDNIAQLIAYGHDGTDYANAAASIKMSVDGAPSGNDMPGKIIFSTNAGGTSTTERLRLTSSGDVSISSNGTIHGVSKVTILPADRASAFSASDGDTWHDIVLHQGGSATNNAVGLAFQLKNDGSYHKNAGTGIACVKNGTDSDYGSDLVFITRPQSAVAVERLRITSDGRVRIGASTDEDVHTGEGADLQVVSTDAGGLTFARDDTTVSNGANLGVIRAYGNDNNGTYQEVASIQFQADLNHGTNDKPGRLVFSTTSDGGSSVEERMRITSKGVTERISRQSATRTYEFSYSDTAGGSGQNKNLFTINDDGNSTATLVAVIDTVGLYGAGDTYIHTSQWITGIRRASSDTAWSATTPQEVGANGSGDADLDVSWSGDTLQANASAWMQWTVFVRVTAYNTTITINA